jgi:hypothetical protein
MFHPHVKPLTRAIHSLEHLAELSDVPDLPLCLSERSLYILQNLAVLDAVDSRRYAKLINPYGYVPVAEEDEEWALFQSVINNLCLELIGGECDMPKVHVWAERSTAQTIKKGEFTTVIYPTVRYDELGGEYDSETGIFSTASENVVFQVRASVMLDSLTWPVGNAAHLRLFYTGVGDGIELDRFASVVASAQYVWLAGSARVKSTVEGVAFYVAIHENLTVDAALYPSAIFNNLFIDRLA